MTSHSLTRFVEAHPFFRILLPLAAGIAVADAGNGFCGVPFLFILLLLVAVWGCMAVATFFCPWRMRVSYGIGLFSFCFLAGWALCSVKWQALVHSWPEEPALYEGRLVDETTEKPRSRLCRVSITSRWDGQEDAWQSFQANVLLYLPKDSASSLLHPGDCLRFYGEVKPPQSFTEDFDYPRYLHHHGVSGNLYTSTWEKIGRSSPAGMCPVAMWQWRQKAIAYYRSCGLADEALAVYAALTLGYKDELSDEVRQLFNISGASHVLALSGLHIGVLCAAFVWMLGRLFRGRNAFIYSRLLALPAVWLYVSVVGAPLSAVRAAVMFSALVIGSCLTRVGFSFNTLCLTAFGMLLYNPFYLFDVGFQMSFAAVASLLLLQPWLHRLIQPRNRVLRYLWGVTTVSLAAQVGVAPLILYYFSRFSPYALVVNLWVVPLAFVLVVSAIPFLLLALFPMGALQQAFGWAIAQLVGMLNKGLAMFNRLPWADMGDISFSAGEVWALYAALFFLFWAWIRSCRRAYIGVLASLCAGVFFRLLATISA